MTTLTPDDRAFLLQTATPCLSIYLPLSRSGPAMQQAPIRWANLLGQARERLAAAGIPAANGAALVTALEHAASARNPWAHPRDALAAFSTPAGQRLIPLDGPVAEQVVVQSHCSILPLLPLLTDDAPFLILALSQGAVRLLRATRTAVTALPLPPSVPASLADATRYDEVERQTGFHTGAPRTGSGRRAAVFYGHGSAGDTEDETLRRYCQQIDHGLQPLLSAEPAPLVLAGVDELVALYRAVADTAHLLPTAIPGSPDRTSDAMLQARALAIVAAERAAGWQRVGEQIAARLGTGTASIDSAEIVAQAEAGRVDTLLLAAGAEDWRQPTQAGQLQPAAAGAVGAEELLNRAAVATLTHGGTAITQPAATLPHGALAAALYRY